jgi:hypothetical protein
MHGRRGRLELEMLRVEVQAGEVVVEAEAAVALARMPKEYTAARTAVP